MSRIAEFGITGDEDDAYLKEVFEIEELYNAIQQSVYEAICKDGLSFLYQMPLPESRDVYYPEYWLDKLKPKDSL